MQPARKFLCPSNKQAHVCCREPTCQKSALKCIGSNQCTDCKENHKKCPRQIGIDNVHKLIQDRKKKCPIIAKNINDQNLIQKLIDQLNQTKNKYKMVDVKRWGLNQNISKLLFQSQIVGKKSYQIVDLIDQNYFYPNIKFQSPPQFKKDVQQVYQVNKQLEERMITLHKSYQSLAEIDCSLQIYVKALQKYGQQKFSQKMQLNKLQQLFIKFKKAIQLRLTISNTFIGIQQGIVQQQQLHYKQIAQRLLNITFTILEYFHNKKKNAQKIIKFVQLCSRLFQEQRKELRLKITTNLQSKLDKLKQFQGYSYYIQKKFIQAYQYFSKLAVNKLTKQILKSLIEMHQYVKYETQKLLQFLLLYQQKLQQNITQERGQQKIKQLKQMQIKNLKMIIKCYEELQQQIKKYEYSKKINEKLKNMLKELKSDDLHNYLQSQVYCLKWQEQNKNFTDAFITISQIIKAIKSRSQNNSRQIVLIDLQVRQRSILLRQFLGHNLLQTSKLAKESAEKYLQKIEKEKKKFQPQQNKYIYTIKQYLAKFLIFYAEAQSNSSIKLQALVKAKQLHGQFKIKSFKLHFMLAKVSYANQHHQAQKYQNDCNQIYPTEICYRNKAFLLFKKYGREKKQNILRQCIQAIDRSLTLEPTQLDLYNLRGIINQNLDKFRISNQDFQKALPTATGGRKFDIQRRMAQNYEQILKSQDIFLKNNPDQKKKIIKLAEQIYKKCLIEQENNVKCLLGYGRILKIQQRYSQAQKIFNKALPILIKQNLKQLIQQTYMQLGDIKLKIAIANDDRDFQMLDEALALYMKAGQSNKNIQNKINVYKQLGDEKKVGQLQKKLY